MFEKPKRGNKTNIQDRLQPTNFEELIRKYDLENKDVYDYLDKLVDEINIYIKKNKFDMPIGSIYMNVNDINPSIFFGGTWERIAKGKTIIGVDENDNDFNETAKIGGEKVHTLNINEIPEHKHDFEDEGRPLYWDSDLTVMGGLSDSGTSVQSTWNAKTKTSGGGQPHNNLPPYFTCYIWQRIA